MTDGPANQVSTSQGVGTLGAWVVLAQYIYLGIPLLAGGIFWLVGYVIHLRFGRFVLEKTDKAESLKHAAEFSRSYRSANFKSIADAIAKLFGRGRPPLELGQVVELDRATLPLHRCGMSIGFLLAQGASAACAVGRWTKVLGLVLSLESAVRVLTEVQ